MSIQLLKGTWPNVNHCCRNLCSAKILSPGNRLEHFTLYVFIFERIVILFFVSFLYKNFIQAWQFFCLWEEWRKLEIKHSLGTEVCNYRIVHIHVFTWNVCDEWSLNNSFSLHGSMIYYMCIIQVIEVKLEIYNVSWFECIHYEWMNLFIYTSTYLKVKKVDKE